MSTPTNVVITSSDLDDVKLWRHNVSEWNVTVNDVITNVSAAPDGRTVAESAVVGLILSLIILLTVGGNLLVCIVIGTNRKLKTYTNYFIASLATADLLLGCLVLPFSVLLTLDPYWPLGVVFCNMYISCDVMLCTVSILTLFAISLDRYFAVTLPLRYTQTMSGKIVLSACSGIWIFSGLMAFLPIHLGWNTPSGAIQNWSDPQHCLFELNKAYVLLVSLGTYFAPLVIMCGVYLKVLQITRDQVKQINKLSHVSPCRNLLPQPAASSDDAGRTLGRTSAARTNGVLPQKGRTTGREHRKFRSHSQSARDCRQVSDTKATVTLASVILAFAICWIPYFTIFTAKPFLRTEVNVHFDLFALWLGYVNSSINPFLYAFYNSAFREGFRKILCRHVHGKQFGRLAALHFTVRSPPSETANAYHMSVTETEMVLMR